VTLLGHPLHELTAEHVSVFLKGAEAEPLLWEAKGTALDKHVLRREVCGFANGHETAYLILGADRREGKWLLDGIDFDDDPPAWVSSVIADGLRPVPLIDIASIRLEGRRQLAIVEITPIAIAPCISRGTVFERVSGRTVPVKDPVRLAELYQRGSTAREAVLESAHNAAVSVITNSDVGFVGGPWPHLALAVSATGHPPDIGSRLFSAEFEAEMTEIIERELIPPLPGAPSPLSPSLRTSFSQSNRIAECEDPRGRGRPCYWHVRVIWNGTVAICGGWDIDGVTAQSLHSNLIEPSWRTAGALLEALGGFGPVQMELQVQGNGRLPGAPVGDPPPRMRLGRGPYSSPPEERMLRGVERELRRAVGEPVYEPGPGDRDLRQSGSDPSF
jgi:hypothetical protein